MRSTNRMIATGLGAVYVAVGLIGFAVTTSTGFAATQGKSLLGIFELNPLHNVVHLLIGAALVIAGTKSVAAARGMNGFIGAAYFVVGIAGLFVVNTTLNILALNSADHVLHFGSAIVLMGTALMADKGVVSESTTTQIRRTA